MSDRKVVATNRKASHDYDLEEPVEAGLVLMGSEIKSIRESRVNLKDGYVVEREGELWLENVHISQYDQASIFGHDPVRPRKLLMHRKEIDKLASATAERGLTLVPLSLYFKDGKAKVELALARGKRTYDKRHDLARRDAAREVDRALRRRR